MRFFGFLLAGVLLARSSAAAQVNSSPSLLNSTTTTNLAVDTASATAKSVSLPVAAEAASRPPVPVVGLQQHHCLQAYAGYTVMVFQQVPPQIYRLKGFDP